MNDSNPSGASFNQEELFSKQLKESTSDIHQKLENHPVSKSILKNNLSLDEYAHYLNCMREIMRAFDEEILPRVSNIVKDASRRKKVNALNKDLEYLQSKGAAIKNISTFKLPVLQNDAQLIGMTYVLEGSTLGGRYILKHIAKNLPLDADHGAEYFDGYADQTGIMWNSFIEVLNSFASGNNQSEIIKGAKAGFDSIYNYFEENI